MSTSGERFESFNWIRGVLDDKRISIIHRAILIRLVVHRQKDGRCDPGYDPVAKELGVNRKTVVGAVDAGVLAGWLAPPIRGRRANANFIFTFAGQEVPPDGTSRTDQEVPPDGTSRTDQEVRLSELRSTAFCVKKSVKKEASQATSEASTGHGHLTGKENGQKKDSHTDEAFERWWPHYPRKVAKGAALKAYRQARRKASEAELLSGVMRYAHERTDQDDKYTKHPATWLNAECWNDAPTASPARKPSYNDSIERGLKAARVDDDAEISP
jgi:hypothetical protein